MADGCVLTVEVSKGIVCATAYEITNLHQFLGFLKLHSLLFILSMVTIHFILPVL